MQVRRMACEFVLIPYKKGKNCILCAEDLFLLLYQKGIQ